MKRALSLFLAMIMVITVIPAVLPVAAEDTAEIKTYAAEPEAPTVSSEAVVYVDANATPEGSTYADLNSAIDAIATTGGTVVIKGTYTINEDTFTENEHSGLIKISAEDGGSIVFGGETVANKLYNLNGDTIFENVTFGVSAATSPVVMVGNFYNSAYVEVAFPANSLIIGGIYSPAANVSTEDGSLYIDNVTGLSTIYAFAYTNAGGFSRDKAISVTVKNTNATNIYGAYRLTGTSTFGDVSYYLSNVQLSNTFVGAQVSGASTIGNIDIQASNVYVAVRFICGAFDNNSNKDSGDKIIGDISVNALDLRIDDAANADSSYYFSGVAHTATVTTGNVNITLDESDSAANGGTISNYVYGVSYDGTQNVKNVTLTINGGNYQGFVYGLGYICEPIVNDVIVNLNGGTYYPSTGSDSIASHSVGLGTVNTDANKNGKFNDGYLNINGNIDSKGVFGLNYNGATVANRTFINMLNANGKFTYVSLASNTPQSTGNVGQANIYVAGENIEIDNLYCYSLGSLSTATYTNVQMNVIIEKAKRVSNMVLGGRASNTAIYGRVNLVWLDGDVDKLWCERNLSDIFLYHDGEIEIGDAASTTSRTIKYTKNGQTIAEGVINGKASGSAVNATQPNINDWDNGIEGVNRINVKKLVESAGVGETAPTVYVNAGNRANVNNVGTSAAPVYDIMDAMYLLYKTGGDIVLQSDIEIGKTPNWGKTGYSPTTYTEYSSCAIINGVNTFAEPIHNGKYTIKEADGVNANVVLPEGGYVYNSAQENKTEFAFLDNNDYITDTYSIYDKGEGKVGIRLNGEINDADIENASFPIVEFGTLVVPASLKGTEVLYHQGACGYGLALQGNAVDQDETTKVAKFVHYVAYTDVLNYVKVENDETASFYSALYGSENGGFADAELTFRTYAVVLLPDGTTTVVYGEEVTKTINGIKAELAA